MRSSIFTLLWIVLTLIGCRTEEPECTGEDSCGFGEVCVEGRCVGQACATSTQCDIESYCKNGKCLAGCENDQDCLPGDTCNLDAMTCETAACTDSQIDCNFQQFCNVFTGECSDASGLYCRECEVNSDCGGNGNVCMHWGLQRDFCGVTCEVETDCPSGYTCTDWLDSETNTVTRQCATYCWLYLDDNRPESPLSQEANRAAGLDAEDRKKKQIHARAAELMKLGASASTGPEAECDTSIQEVP